MRSTTIDYDKLSEEAIEHGMDVPTYIEHLKAISENEHIREAQKATLANSKSSSAAIIVIVLLVAILLSAIAYIILSPKPEETTDTKASPETHSETTPHLYNRPANGLIMRGFNATNKEALLDVSVGNESDYYILLYYNNGFDISFGLDCYNFAFYARAGETVSINVPVGTAKIYYATGDIWYGKNNLFGDDTSRYASDDIFDFYNYDYEVTLYPVSDGNMETHEVYNFPE